MKMDEPCGTGCLVPAPNAWVRRIASTPDDPVHPFGLPDSTVTLEVRRDLLRRLQQERPAHVAEISGVCDCSFKSPLPEGKPLQDFGLGPDAAKLVAPAGRHLARHPLELERLLSELASGLQALHRLGVAHGNPTLMNAFCAGADDRTLVEAVWVDLSSVRPATPEAVAVDVAGFVLTCMWPALLDAGHHSPSLFEELAGIQSASWFGLEQVGAALRAERSDHTAGGGRPALLEALRTHTGASNACDSVRSLSSFLAPAYLLDQARSDQTARFMQTVFNAERTRNVLMEEERTRLLNHRFEENLTRNRAAIDELRAWGKELQEAVRFHHDRANASEVLGARLLEERDIARGEAWRLTTELEGILNSKAWRVARMIWSIRRAAGRLIPPFRHPRKAPQPPAAPAAPQLDPQLQPAGPVDLTHFLPPEFPAGTGRPVLVSLPWFVTGGADRFVEYLLSHWRDHGRTVVVITTTPLGENMESRFDELLKLTSFAYDLNAMGPAHSWYPFVDAVLTRLERPSIFNVGSQWMYDSMGKLRASHPELRVVDQQFNDIGHLASNRRVKEHLALTVAAHHALSEIIRTDGRSADEVVTAYVGIPSPERAAEQKIAELRSELGISASKVVLFIGRFSEEKRPEWVVALAADLAGDDVAVVMVGSGPDEAALSKGIEALPNLVWRRYIDSIGSVIGLADVLVLPSRTEGIPLTVMEAVSLGKPVVATRVGGLGELEDIPGFTLCEPDDFPGFVAAVRQTLDTPAPPGIALPDCFGVEHMVSTYDKLIDGPQHGAGPATIVDRVRA